MILHRAKVCRFFSNIVLIASLRASRKDTQHMRDYGNKLFEVTDEWLDAKIEDIAVLGCSGETDGLALHQYNGALGALRNIDGLSLENQLELLASGLNDIAMMLRRCEDMDDNNLDDSGLTEYLRNIVEESTGVFALGTILQMSKGLSAYAPDYLVPEDIARGFILEQIEPMVEKEEEEKGKAMENIFFEHDLDPSVNRERLYRYARYLFEHGKDTKEVKRLLIRANKEHFDGEFEGILIEQIVKSAELLERFAPKKGEKPLKESEAKALVKSAMSYGTENK